MASGRIQRRRVVAGMAGAAASLVLPSTAYLAPLRSGAASGAFGVAPLALPSDHPADPADELIDFVGWVDVPRYFPETGHNVDGDFVAHFWSHGGADVFGFPLTEPFWEPADDDGGPGLLIQYFQRARLELSLDSGELRRSALGSLLDKQQPAVPPSPRVRYFPETGHNVGRSFLVFFEEAGGVEALGQPLSEEVEEYGRPVQWFERARLEWWPEHADARVQFGLIGEEYLQMHRDEVPDEALLPARPLAPLREWHLPVAPEPPRIAWAPADVPILYYHQVPSQPALRGQIRAFREAGREIVPLAHVVATLRGEGPPLPEKPLVLTFDDGWASQSANAAPVLQAEDVPATFFVITRFLGEVPGYMTWDQVRVLKELGHAVESHTQNHPSVDRLYAEDQGAALAELWESLAVLERRLGRSERLFAYPNGTWNETVAGLAAQVYRAAVATGGGTFQSQPQLYHMRRIKAETSYKPADLLRQMP